MSALKEKRDDQDLQILGRCLKGETEAFAQIIEAYKQPIFRLVYRWVGHSDTAEEVLQDVFLKAFRQIKNFRGESKFSTWLFQIALNRCRDIYRSRKSKPEEFPLLERPLEDSSPREDEKLGALEEAGRLRRALASLPPIYREAVSLRYLNEMSNEEISQVTGESLSNVKMRVARGLIKLRKSLEKVAP